MYYTQEQIDRANQADLVSFLQGRGEQLTRAGQEYRWKRHDSLTVRGNKYGGTSLILNMISIGLVLSVDRHNHRFIVVDLRLP